MGLGPLPQATQTLGEGSGVRGVIRLPDPSAQVGERLLQVLGPVPDLEERMEKAEDQRHSLEQRLPGRLGGRPAVGVDRVRPVFLVLVSGLYMDEVVRGGQV